MHIQSLNRFLTLPSVARQSGVSLLELVVFIVVVGVASGALFKTYNYSVMNHVDPMIKVRAVESAQSKLDEILALKYDHNTPTGGVPACDSTNPLGLVCTNAPDADMNDIDDFNGYSDVPYTGYTRNVTVTTASNEKLIIVTVAGPRNISVILAAYRANF